MSDPLLSVLVNFHNMTREADRTLFSLSRSYQRNSEIIDYEVIAIDNGSTQPLSNEYVARFGENFRYHFHPATSPSPVEALNLAARMARGEVLMIMIDGAHIVSPGVIDGAARALRAFANPFIATVAFHLGPAVQNLAHQTGYNREEEDRLLATVDWRANGYELFRLVHTFADKAHGWFGQLFESSCFALRKSTYWELGGLDERFQSPGGGLINLDFFRQAVTRPDLEYVVLLGEGTFHQIHGGVTTNVPPEQHPGHRFHQEYIRIRGANYDRANRRPIYFGAIPEQALKHTRASASLELREWTGN